MTRHHRDYALDEEQKKLPLLERQGRMLCGVDLGENLMTLAFWWCPIEKIGCPTCRAARERMEQRGIWPTKKIANQEGRGAESNNLDGWVYEA